MARMSRRALRMYWNCRNKHESGFEGSLAVLQLFVLAEVEIIE